MKMITIGSFVKILADQLQGENGEVIDIIRPGYATSLFKVKIHNIIHTYTSKELELIYD